MSIEIKRSDKYVDYNISAANNRGYITIDTSDWINKPWMFYELPSLKFEIYTETDGELVKYQNFTREIRTYNPVYSPLGVLNVTIDIRNVPEEFILRITPIFDNDAVNARNMLVENGIEDGDIWGSDQDVPTQLFNLNLEFIECEGEYVPPTPPVPPTHEETITSIPPITFDGSTGEPLVSWTILGNGQQTGAPSPDNIIMPEFVGVRTGNLFDISLPKTDYAANVYQWTLRGLTPNAQYTCSSNFVQSGTTASIWFGGTSSGANGVSANSPKTMTANSNGEIIIYINHSYNNAYDQIVNKTTWVMVNTGSTALPYEPFGYKIPISCGGETTPVYLGQVSTVRRVKKQVLTGDEWWGKEGGVLFYNDQIILMPAVQYADAYCSHYRLGSSYTDVAVKEAAFAVSKRPAVFIHDTRFSTVADFKAYLAAQYAAGTPVTVWYVLSEPTTGIVNEPLCKIGDHADELSSTNSGVTIQTVDGDNVLTVDTDLQPSEVTITYTKEGQ